MHALRIQQDGWLIRPVVFRDVSWDIQRIDLAFKSLDVASDQANDLLDIGDGGLVRLLIELSGMCAPSNPW